MHAHMHTYTKAKPSAMMQALPRPVCFELPCLTGEDVGTQSSTPVV